MAGTTGPASLTGFTPSLTDFGRKGSSLEAISGFQTGHGASFVRLILVLIGALLGGSIYHLSRAHIRYLLER